MYQLEFSEEAARGAALLKKSDVYAFKKLAKLIVELQEHPTTGTGKPELLKGLNGVWSRRIDKKNRLRYTIDHETVLIFVVSVLGHYEDK